MKEENQTIIRALNKYGRVPQQYELLNEIDRLNNIIDELEKWLNKISKLTANIDEKMTCKNILDKLNELKWK